MSERSPTLAEVLTRAVDSRLEGVHTAIPARVERYDAAKQQCDAKPLVKSFYTDEEGKQVSSSLPVVTNVPVVFPGGGGFRMVFPLQQGDTVLLVFSEGSLDKWLSQGGEVDPIDPRRHDLADGIAIPGLKPFNAPWQDAAGNFITLGSDSGTAQFAALANLVKQEIEALRNAYAGHGHNVSTVGSAAAQSGVTMGGPTIQTTPSVPATPLLPQTVPTVQSVASATVKIKG